MSKRAYTPTDDGYVYVRYIVKNGKRIYPRNGKVFRFKDRRHKEK